MAAPSSTHVQTRESDQTSPHSPMSGGSGVEGDVTNQLDPAP